MNDASCLEISVSFSEVTFLNQIAAFEREGDMSSAKKCLHEFHKRAVMFPGHYPAQEGLAYPETDSVELFRELQFNARSLSQDEVEQFTSIGFPNPREGNGFNLFLFRVERDVLSMGALSVFNREYDTHHATLREGLIFLKAFPEAFSYHAVHFMGSFRKMRTTDHLEVPSICTDGGIKLLSKHRQDPDDFLSHQVYAIVRRGLNAHSS